MKVITSPLQKKIVCLQMYTHAQVALVQTCTSTVEMKCVTAQHTDITKLLHIV